MSIDATGFGDVESLYNPDKVDLFRQWKGRQVQEAPRLSPNLAIYLQGIQPRMSGGNFTGGASYSEREGFKVEVKVEIEFGPTNDRESKKTESSSAEASNTPPEPPDNRDRDH